MIRLLTIACVTALLVGCAGRQVTMTMGASQSDRTPQMRGIETPLTSGAQQLFNFTMNGENERHETTKSRNGEVNFGIGLFPRDEVSHLFLDFGLRLNWSPSESFFAGPTTDCSYGGTCKPSRAWFKTSFEQHSFPVTLLGDVPLWGSGVSLFGRLGATYQDIDLQTDVCNLLCIANGGFIPHKSWQQKSFIGLLGGVGARWKHLSVEYSVEQAPLATGWEIGRGDGHDSSVDLHFGDKTLVHTLSVGFFFDFSQQR